MTSSPPRPSRTSRSGELDGDAFVPRHFAWRGRVGARALFFDARAARSPASAAHVLSSWRAGTRLLSLEGGLLVVWTQDTFVDARLSDGLPFVDVDGALCALPLTKKERERVARGDLVRAVGGRVVTRTLTSLPEVPAGALVDVSGFHVVDVESLAAPAPVLPPAPPRTVSVDARAVLLGDTTPNPERDSVARALRGEPVPEPEGSGLKRAQHRAARGLPAESAGESLMRALVKALEATGIMGKLQAIQRQYVEDTLAQLKDGNLEDALKRAVPLAKPGAGSARPPLPNLGMPGIRPDLNLSSAPKSSSASPFIVETDLYTRMRESYRAAARKLEQAKRFREAAFVYLELLGEVAEAVNVLERSGDRKLLRLAAEIAEAHALPPDVVARQWLLANDVERCMELARRHGVFAQTVAGLERSSRPAEALALRREWAAHLARTSAFASAVDVLWQARHANAAVGADVRALLDAGIAAHNADLPTLVARRIDMDLAARPAEEPRDTGLLQVMVDDDAPGAAAARLQLAFALGVPPAQMRTTTSALVRALCADASNGAGLGGLGGSAVHLKQLTDKLADTALKFDMPPAPARPVGRHPSQILVLDGPAGRSVAEDVAPLAGGRVVVALGEAGAAVVTRNGGAASRSREPAAALVTVDGGARALLVARRGELLRISRYDLSTGASSHWIDVRAHAFAPSSDGDFFFIARRNDVVALDALADVPRVLWQTTLPTPALALARDPSTLAVAYHAAPANLVAVPDAQQQQTRIVTFDARTLARRDERQAPDHAALWLNARAEVLGIDWPEQPQVTPPGTFQLHTPPGSTPTSFAALGEMLGAVAFEGDEQNGAVAHPRGGTRLVMQLDAHVVALRAHAHDTTLVVADDRGRVFVVDTVRGTLEQALALP